MTYPSFIPVRYQQPLNVALVLGLILVVYFIGKKLKLWDQPKAEGSEVGLDPNKPKPRAGFNPGNAVNKLAGLLSIAWDGEYQDEQAFDMISSPSVYNDNELILIHNTWRETYAGGDFWGGIKPTLRSQINAETIAFYRTTGLAKKKKALARLDNLNL